MFPKSALTVVYNILIVGRVFLTPIFYEDPPYIAYPRFQILSNTLPRPPSSTPTVFFLFSCSFDWMGDRATFDVLFYLMIIRIYKCRPLVP